jgi:hypothetical protein
VWRAPAIVFCGLFAGSLMLDQAGIADLYPPLDSSQLLLSTTLGIGPMLAVLLAGSAFLSGFKGWSAPVRVLLGALTLLPLIWYGMIVVQFANLEP